MNYIWGAMILIGILVASFNGKIGDITTASIKSAEDAIMLCIRMLGVVSMWTGLMKIAEKAGLIKSLSEKMMPLLVFLFPKLPKNSKAMQYISTNIIANVIGVSWAATPAGLKAMDELQKLNHDKNVASREMCMFMIINMSSLQLISVNLLAYRSQYNSANPSEIIGPGLAVTVFSTIVGVIVAKLFERWFAK